MSFCPRRSPLRDKLLINVSVVGQIMHYRSARPVLKLLLGTETFNSFDVDTLTDHITTFSLSAIERIAEKAIRQEAT